VQSTMIIPLVIGLLAGIVLLGSGAYLARKTVASAKEDTKRLLQEARQDADDRKKEILVSAQESALAQQEEANKREADSERIERELEERSRLLERDTSDLARQRKAVEAEQTGLERLRKQTEEDAAKTKEVRIGAQENLERIAGLSVQEARVELTSQIEEQARKDAKKISRRIEEDARESAERNAIDLMVQAFEQLNTRKIAESTVSFIELPSDEMKGRIIGKEGRNIRALEMATGIDLVVDDTPRSILISSFDPIRREIARLAIDRLVGDGRIHPARIEEVVQKIREEFEDLIVEQGNEAAYFLGISDLHPRLTQLIGRMHYFTWHGQNLLQHSLETAMMAGFMARRVGASAETAERAGLLHDISMVDEQPYDSPTVHSAELCRKFNEPDDVVRTIRALQPDAKSKTVESLLVSTANHLSKCRPGARKENLAIFIERLRRLEDIATSFAGVTRAYSVKAGKEIRVIVDCDQTADSDAYSLSKQIARAIERELNFPGQIKVCVIRETRSVRYAV
jgi:ribonuclease Y